MDTITKYKKEIREMFFISVNSNIDKWTLSKREDYIYSPIFFESDDLDDNTMLCSKFQLDLKDNELLIITNNNSVVISIYKKKRFIRDLKVNYYVSKLKKHFIQIKKDNLVKSEIESLKTSLSRLERSHVKYIRSKKLKRLK